MTIENLWSATCSGDIPTLKEYFETQNGERNLRYRRFNMNHSLIMGAYRNNEMATVNYLIGVGETILPHEKKEVAKDLGRLDYFEEYQKLLRLLEKEEDKLV